jgi:hydrogenase nickel incorporation protein HypB
MFQSAGVVVVSKTDLATACDYDREAAQANLRRLAPKAPVFELSAKTGQGMDAWCEFLIQQHKAIKARDPLGA